MVDSSALSPFAERATELLLRLARERDPSLARAYDELLFRDLHDVIRRRGVSLAMQAAGSSDSDVWVPRVQPADLEAIALDATVAALERARRTADRFDPARGDGASWALGAAGFAYIDVVRDFYQVRRKAQSVSVDPADLEGISSRHTASASPEYIVETRAQLLEALKLLTDVERYAVLARAQYGMSYAEIATYLYGDPLAVKKVDTLLQRSRRKLAEAERAWNEQS